ncbi:hypothetical protein NEUTE2DRAFT_55074 [Neurospora tetrasperma FGSC 2509]|nr:hypothetical protein NEUTE2DRAFT_55074 [Neurospora tetrasperma FGSC 2509]
MTHRRAPCTVYIRSSDADPGWVAAGASFHLARNCNAVSARPLPISARPSMLGMGSHNFHFGKKEVEEN